MSVRLLDHAYLIRNTRVALLAVAVLGVALGVSYLPAVLPSKLPGGLAVMSVYVPVWFWAVAWIAAGVASFVGVWKVWPAATVGVVGMSGIWLLVSGSAAHSALPHAGRWQYSTSGVLVALFNDVA